MEDCSEVLSGEPRREEGDTGPGADNGSVCPSKVFLSGRESRSAGRAEIY